MYSLGRSALGQVYMEGLGGEHRKAAAALEPRVWAGTQSLEDRASSSRRYSSSSKSSTSRSSSI